AGVSRPGAQRPGCAAGPEHDLLDLDPASRPAGWREPEAPLPAARTARPRRPQRRDPRPDGRGPAVRRDRLVAGDRPGLRRLPGGGPASRPVVGVAATAGGREPRPAAFRG